MAGIWLIPSESRIENGRSQKLKNVEIGKKNEPNFSALHSGLLKFLTRRDLVRQQESFDPFSFPADGHSRKPSIPAAIGSLWF
ncbi:MAG: hypothetical protein ACI9VS_002597 [Candidatus Binatia bacterium]|jgi:hypothetical protein